jgi:hypothetical protein
VDQEGGPTVVLHPQLPPEAVDADLDSVAEDAPHEFVVSLRGASSSR